MPGIPLTQVYKAVTQIRTDDRTWSFGQHWNCDSGYSATQSGTDLADAIATQHAAALNACLSADSTVEAIHVTHALPETAQPGKAIGGSNPGTDSADAMSPNTCVVVSLYSDSVDVVRQGRLYLGGIAKARLVDGQWTALFITTVVDTFADLLIAGMTGGSSHFEPVLVRRIDAGVPVTPFALPITSHRLSRVCYTQRRRTTVQWGFAP